MTFMTGGNKPDNSGRKAGTPNKVSASVRTAFQQAFEAIGGVESFSKWAAANPDNFYKLYARMLPLQGDFEIKTPTVEEERLMPATDAWLKGLMQQWESEKGSTVTVGG